MTLAENKIHEYIESIKNGTLPPELTSDDDSEFENEEKSFDLKSRVRDYFPPGHAREDWISLTRFERGKDAIWPQTDSKM